MKFKVWDKVEKKWNTTDTFFLDSCGSLKYLNHDGEIHDHSGIVAYSTGKQDFKGVELFTGDILDLDQERYPEDRSVKIIIWEKGAFRLWSKQFEINNYPYSTLFDEILIEDSVKIGNRFENPELAEQQGYK